MTLQLERPEVNSDSRITQAFVATVAPRIFRIEVLTSVALPTCIFNQIGTARGDSFRILRACRQIDSQTVLGLKLARNIRKQEYKY